MQLYCSSNRSMDLLVVHKVPSTLKFSRLMTKVNIVDKKVTCLPLKQQKLKFLEGDVRTAHSQKVIFFFFVTVQ